MITVRDFAKVLTEEGIILVAGEAGQEAVLQYCNVQENPFKSSRIKANSFIMSTFYGFESINEIMEHLAWYVEIGVCAVGFHSLKYVTVPPEIIQFADENLLPLFYIPNDTPYALLFDKFNKLQQQNALRTRDQVDKVNESILEAVLLGKDVHFIIHAIADYLQATVIFLDDQIKVVSWRSQKSIASSEIERVAAYLKRNQSQLLLTKDTEHRPAEIYVYQKDNSIDSVHVYPLVNNLHIYGYLLVGMVEDTAAVREAIIKNAITALLLEAAKRNATREYHKNEDIKLFETIFHKKMDQFLTADDFYYNVSGIRKLIIAEPVEADGMRESYFFLSQYVKQMDSECLLWVFERRIIGLVQTIITPQSLQFVSEGKVETPIGISGKLQYFSPSGLKKAYDQAVAALEYSRRQQLDFCFWDMLGVEKITYSLGQSDLLKELDLEVLAPLLDYDRQNRTDFAYTLYIYLRTYFSLKQSGDVLFLHPNTVKYRINKIQEILRANIYDPDQYLLLMVALRLYFDKQGRVVP